MIIPSSSFASFSSVKKPVAGGGGSDVTPNAVNWANVAYGEGLSSSDVTSRQISGINQTITLRANYTSAQGADKVYLYYRLSVSGGSDTSVSFLNFTPEEQGFAQIIDNATFTVTNNQYVDFTTWYGASWIPPIPATATVTITNVTDSNTSLDTFTITVQF
jgi:uncharacterized protein YneR